MKTTKKILNAWICSLNNNQIKPVFGDIFIDNGRISKIKKKSFDKFLRGNYRKTKDSYDAKGKVVTIPNINFHEHIYSRLAKGLPIKGKTNNFENILKNIWWKLDVNLDLKMVEASAQLTAIESIKNGVTYLFDHHSSQSNISRSLKTISDVLQHSNLRSVLAFETTDRNDKNTKDQSLTENENAFLELTNSETKFLFGLHASFTINDDTLLKISNFVKLHNCGIHIHLCEDFADRKISKDKFGSLPLNRLIKYNLLNDKSILSHSIHLTKSEYKKILKHNSAIAFNPDSNMNNSVGINNFKNIPAELKILCGTDGMHANPAKSLKSLFLLPLTS